MCRWRRGSDCSGGGALGGPWGYFLGTRPWVERGGSLFLAQAGLLDKVREPQRPLPGPASPLLTAEHPEFACICLSPSGSQHTKEGPVRAQVCGEARSPVRLQYQLRGGWRDLRMSFQTCMHLAESWSSDERKGGVALVSQTAAVGTPGTILVLCSGKCREPRPRPGPRGAPGSAETKPDTSSRLVVWTGVEGQTSGLGVLARHCLGESGFL